MFKLFILAKTGPGRREAFRADFSEFAGDLPNLSEAVINEVISFTTRQETETVNFDDPRYDHICELGFTDLADMLSVYRRMRGPSGAGRSLSLTPETSRLIPTRTFIQRDLPPVADDPRKLFTPVRERPDRSRAAFHDHWHSHGPLILDKVPGVRGYHQNHTVDAGYEEDPDCWGGVAEFWFDSLDAVSALPETDPKSFSAITADELAFLGPVPIENYVAIPVVPAMAQ
jgi:uncharacterized protein (TIGR02118 family)